MEHTYTVALAGNPNVGKSTVFNRLTGLRQHTGNWPGKTVERAEGYFSQAGQRFRLVDLPGTYSLAADSPEEEVAGAFLQSGQADAVIVVVDASCLRRGLILALQLRQQTQRLVLCVNLMDEAARRGITPQTERLGQLLDVPVVATAARSGKGLAELRRQAAEVCRRESWEDGWRLTYAPPVEAALGLLETGMSRRRAVALLWGSPPTEGEQSLWQRAQQRLGALSGQALRDSLTASVVALAEEIGRQCVRCTGPDPHAPDRRLDRLLTSRLTGFPVMLLLLGLVFYLTIQGANAPSRLLSRWLTALEEPLRGLLAGAPWWVQGAVVDGIYRTVAWVVAVMLPPMAIFFPLFTLLEDAGYLPRVAFCMDWCFRAAGACGRQSLTMAMGFGCNACGVTGCRIIASPRERLVAILTNCFVPCNGRFPTLIALIGLFFLGDAAGPGRSALAAAVFLGVIVFCVAMTLAMSKLLSATVLRGQPSFFSLELPPYRLPQVGRVLVRSLLDRTVFVLGRALTVTAPAGLLIWGMGNMDAGGVSLLERAAGVLSPLGRLMGLDGMVLLAFLLGFPANEIVLPILLMGYLHTGTLTECGGLEALRAILLHSGWTTETALCMMALCLLHFPCGTTCLTIRRETGSRRWTLLAMVLPTAVGMAVCMLIHGAFGLLG